MGYPDVSCPGGNGIEVWSSGKSSEQKIQISEKGNPWHRCDFPGRNVRAKEIPEDKIFRNINIKGLGRREVTQ